MSIAFHILGDPGRDNALLLRIDSGHAVSKILFDCGDCLGGLESKEIQSIDHLMFSHLHMDHVAGFDSYFRCNHDRVNRENHVWGPVGSADIMQHRFQGFLWNLCKEMQGTWFVHEFDGNRVVTRRFELAEGFATAHPAGEREVNSLLLESDDFEVRAYVMEHRGPSLAYHVIEKARENFDMDSLKQLGLTAGPWLRELKSGRLQELDAGGRLYKAEELKAALVKSKPGQQAAYLTDFLLDEEVIDFLSEKLQGLDVMVCEAQYRGSDLELARKHHHMTSELCGSLARRSGAGDLLLIHLSDRYSKEEWREMLEEVRQSFPKARFPEHWELGAVE